MAVPSTVSRYGAVKPDYSGTVIIGNLPFWEYFSRLIIIKLKQMDHIFNKLKYFYAEELE
jgi:hypothetical protein